MKFLKYSATLFACTVTGAAVAQFGPPPPVPPAGTVRVAPPGAFGEWPRLTADHRLMVTYFAPTAKSVEVIAGTGSLNDTGGAMTRSPQGYWQFTSSPLRAGRHDYWLMVDGVRVPQDPVEVPGEGDAFYQLRNVPHGQVRVLYYHSTVAGDDRRLFVYTPPGYDQTNRRYPVYYVAHGGGDNEASWLQDGKANLIIDNLIAEGRAKPMILVMPLGFPNDGPPPPMPTQALMAKYRLSGVNDFQAVFPFTAGAFGQKMPRAPKLESMYVDEIIPMIDRTFRTVANADNRAISGQSMGSIQAIIVGLGHPELFRSVGIWSGATIRGDLAVDYNGLFADPSAFNRRMKLLYQAGSSREPNSHRALDESKAQLDARGIRNVTFKACCEDHVWMTWRRELADFAPRLFR